MSGGIAYVLTKKQFENGLCNMEMVALETLETETSY
jgi:glutamate synthase (ferredoxin)